MHMYEKNELDELINGYCGWSIEVLFLAYATLIKLCFIIIVNSKHILHENDSWLGSNLDKIYTQLTKLYLENSSYIFKLQCYPMPCQRLEDMT